MRFFLYQKTDSCIKLYCPKSSTKVVAAYFRNLGDETVWDKVLAKKCVCYTVVEIGDTTSVVQPTNFGSIFPFNKN